MRAPSRLVAAGRRPEMGPAGYSLAGRTPGLDLAALVDHVGARSAEPFIVSTGAQVLGAGGVAAVALRFDTGTGYVLRSLRLVESVANATAIRVSNLQTGEPWDDGPALGSLVAGLGVDPYVLPSPCYLAPGRDGRSPSLRVELSDVGGAGVTAELVCEGYRLPAAVSPNELDVLAAQAPFWYVATVAIGAGVGTAATLNVAAHDDSIFLLQDVNAFSRTAWDLTIQKSTSGRMLTSVATRIEALAGSGQRPGTLTQPIMVGPSELLALTLTNRQAGAQTARLALCGTKVYR